MSNIFADPRITRERREEERRRLTALFAVVRELLPVAQVATLVVLIGLVVALWFAVQRISAQGATMNTNNNRQHALTEEAKTHNDQMASALGKIADATQAMNKSTEVNALLAERAEKLLTKAESY